MSSLQNFIVFFFIHVRGDHCMHLLESSLESEFSHHFYWSLKLLNTLCWVIFTFVIFLAQLQLWNIFGKWSKHKMWAKISLYIIYGEKRQQNVPFPTMTRGFSAYWMRSMASFILSGSASVLGGSRHLTLGLNQTSMKYPEAIHLSKCYQT